jgi:hypothetical protein
MGQKYPIWTFDRSGKDPIFKRLEFAEGEKVVINGFESYSFILHRDLDYPYWNVIEETTSALISWGNTRKAEAIVEAKRNLKKAGKAVLNMSIKAWKQQYGCIQDYLNNGQMPEVKA